VDREWHATWHEAALTGDFRAPFSRLGICTCGAKHSGPSRGHRLLAPLSYGSLRVTRLSRRQRSNVAGAELALAKTGTVLAGPCAAKRQSVERYGHATWPEAASTGGFRRTVSRLGISKCGANSSAPRRHRSADPSVFTRLGNYSRDHRDPCIVMCIATPPPPPLYIVR
jgi:hypothetical protein